MSSIGLAVPNLNQGRFLHQALESAVAHRHKVHVAVLDAGSTDQSQDVMVRWGHALAYARSRADEGQAAAINEGISELCARLHDVEFVGWLNADDYLLPGALDIMADALLEHREWVAVTGGGVQVDESGTTIAPIETWPFAVERFAIRCTICQPASLIRRAAWEAAGGLDARLDMCFDYDLWWKLASQGTIGYIEDTVAAARDHSGTKTRGRRAAYFEEARRIVARECGTVPWHWYISEALEREVGFELGVRPIPPRRLRAGARALLRFARDRWVGPDR